MSGIPDIDISVIASQLILVTAACILLLIGAFVKKHRMVMPYLTVVSFLIAAYVSFSAWGSNGQSGFNGFIIRDSLTLFSDLLFFIGGILTTLISMGYGSHKQGYGAEYYAILLFATCGMSLMAGALNLLTFFMGLEVLSVSLYILIGYERYRIDSNESAVKYFLLGSFASAFALYGIALIYGGVGSLSYTEIASALMKGAASGNLLILAGFGLLLAGLGFKISMVPFHAWTPDVYEGAPTPIAAFLSTTSKAASFAVLIRLFAMTIEHLYIDWAALLSLLSVLTMTVGNVVALIQRDVKRMLAYSSIAHVGYILVGLIVGGSAGYASVLFYLFVYTFMNLTAFGVITLLEQKVKGHVTFDDCTALGYRYPILAAAMTIAMLSLGGIPPTAGFVGKFYIFKSAVESGYIWLAIAGVLNSAVSLYYYLRLTVAMYMKESEDSIEIDIFPFGHRIALLFSTLSILIIGIIPSNLLSIAKEAVKGLF